GVAFRMLPSLRQLVRGDGKLRYLHKVDVDDLLMRAPTAFDEDAIGRLLGGRRVMVTGAGGSIGAGLCRQAARFGIRSLRLVERAESPSQDVTVSMRAEHPLLLVSSTLADVRDTRTMTEIFEQFRPQIIFHAAAYKHVALLEEHPGEAVLNNVVGTARLAKMAQVWGAETFVFVSTDKAVHPTSLMGATKRLCEMYVMALGEASAGVGADTPRTRYVGVRFGNVLGSAGSVVPRFDGQIESGQPLTITDPGASRFFMT